MPLKVRCMRKSSTDERSIAFVKNGEYKNIYLHQKGKSSAIPFETAVKIFEAPKSEEGILPIADIHYQHINNIIDQFESDLSCVRIASLKFDQIAKVVSVLSI